MNLTGRERTILRIVNGDGVNANEFRGVMPGLVAKGLVRLGLYNPDKYFLTPAGEAELKELELCPR